MSLLKVEELTTKYGQIVALNGISLEVEQGEIVALIGANGAGKSTTLRTISGALRPSQGKVIFDGQEIQRRQLHEIVDMGVIQCPEGRRIFRRMSVEENLLMGYYSRRRDNDFVKSLDRVFDLFPVLMERYHQIGNTLSGGEQQMLAIGRALLSKPRLLMLDEPSLGLAPILVGRVFETVKRIHDEGTTILLVEQNARAALSVADRGYVLEVGEIVMEGTGRQLLHDERVRSAYLGG